MSLRQLTKFVDQINALRSCKSPGCGGSLVPVSVKSVGLGGALNIEYNCNGCTQQRALFETSSFSNYKGSDRNDVSVAVQVAFIVAGCMHSTYYKTLQQALGMKAVTGSTFLSTIERMHAIVKEMLDEMCESAKQQMKAMDQDKLGSWSKAVTTADGVWMTRGWHSKNATFSIRDYCNAGALLYYMHLCQRGRDDLVKEELFQGTSKSAEGYAARKTFTRAKEEGMNAEVHWQDADSSSSNAVTEIFPNCKVMICSGHAGRAHLKILQGRAKRKSFSKALKDKYRKQYPQVDNAVCHCEEKHHPGCGCLTKAFTEKARNNFSLILSQSQTAGECSTKINALAKHARDEHKWDGGSCDFHPQLQCSCGKCEDKEDLKCPGERYKTRNKLSCPFHSLAYEIECYERSQIADQLVHDVLKRGHSNWVEASHNVLIRFRPKHINLVRLHYELSTNLGLLQANMTYLYKQEGPKYHWIPELYKRLKLPLFDGVEQTLEDFNKKRMSALKRAQTDESKKRRLQLKIERKKEGELRKMWSKKHGHDTYGEIDEDLEQDHTAVKGAKENQKAVGVCRCGSTTHHRSNHRDCPMNKKSAAPSSNAQTPAPQLKGDVCVTLTPAVQDKGDVSEVSSEDDSDGTECFDDVPSDGLYEGYDCLDDYVITEQCSDQLCDCGAQGRGHKRECPSNSRNRYSRHPGALFPPVDDPLHAQSDDTCSSVVPAKGVGELKVESGNSVKLDSLPPPAKRRKGDPKFGVGDYVTIHSSTLEKHHVPCRIVQVFGERYKLCCQRGVLRTVYPGRDLMAMALTSNCSIPLDKWCEAPKVSLRDIKDDPNCLEQCNCILVKSYGEAIDLSEDSVTVSESSDMWVKNLLCSLTHGDRKTILSEVKDNWLTDKIIAAAQLLILQHAPTLHGLQSPIRFLVSMCTEESLFKSSMFEVATGAPFPMSAVRKGQSMCMTVSIPLSLKRSSL